MQRRSPQAGLPARRMGTAPLTPRGHFAAGLAAEAVSVLQDAGLWRYAATLAAGSLPPGPRAAALDRWAAHVHQVCRQGLANRNDGPCACFGARTDCDLASPWGFGSWCGCLSPSAHMPKTM